MTTDVGGAIRRAISHHKLIEAVRAIDPEAAQWLEENQHNTNMSPDLLSNMGWKETPQGHHYWSNLHDKLGG